MYTRDDRITIRISKTGKLYEYIYVDTVPADGTIEKRLERLLVVAAQKEDDILASAWEDFVRRISFFYPAKRLALEKLYPLILRKIIRGDEIEEAYWEEIKKP